MKRFVSLIVALVMLLSVCAMAEGKEISIGNFVYSDNAGNSLDLTGIELKFAAAENNGKVGASVAVEASGEDVVRAVISADEEGIYLSADGISDVYGLSMETIEQLITTYASEYMDQLPAIEENAAELMAVLQNILTEAIAIVEQSIVPAGTEEIDGKVYDAYNFTVTAEQTMEIMALIDQLVALYPQVLEGSGYSSVVEMIEAEGVEISYEGQIFMSEDEVIEDIYMMADGEAVLNAYISVENVYYEDEDLNGLDIYLALYDPYYEDFDESKIGFAFATVYTDPANGEFVMFDMSVGEGASNGDVYTALYLGREGDETSNKYFTICTMDDAVAFDVLWGKYEDSFRAQVELADNDQGIGAVLQYEMTDNGQGGFALDCVDGNDEYHITGDITISDTDGAWLPEIGETVDIMTIDEAQMNKLSLEAMGIAGKLISACSAASEDFSQLISSMM